MNFKRINKQLIIVSVVALHTMTTFASPQEAVTYTSKVVVADVPTTHWAYGDISYLKEKGIITFNQNNQFFPSNQMTYFEVAQMLANATGYVNVQITPNIDETFKQQMMLNYNKQKPIIDKYASGKSGWDNIYTQEVAYILGRGYIKESDLNKFMTSSTERAIMTKEDLAACIVRILGKEVTAKNNYKPGAFNDEASIAEENRPHMAYLKSLGLINPDANGNCNPKTKITKALAAKMVADAVQYKESTSPGEDNKVETETEIVTVKKVITKNNDEYYILVDKGTGDKYYSVKNTLKVTDASGKETTISSLKPEQKIEVTYEFVNNTDYITSIKLVGDVVEETTPPEVATTTVKGKLTQQIISGIVRVEVESGEDKVYILDSDATITLDGVAVNSTQLNVGDELSLEVYNATVKSVKATKGNGTVVDNNLTEGEVISKEITAGGLKVTIKQGEKTGSVIISEDVVVRRNNKIKNVEDIRIGDKLTVTNTNGKLTSVSLTGEQVKIQGTVKEIHIAQNSKIIVTTTGGEVATYTVNPEAQIYDVNSRKYISLRELRLGQKVELLFESKELIGVDVIKGSSAVNYKGTIKYISNTSDYMDVVVDYDPLTGETGVYKRILLPSTISVIDTSNREVRRSSLREGMEVIATYEYLDDMAPQKILIIK